MSARKQARLIEGEELGDVRAGLVFYGHHIGIDWTDLGEVASDVEAKLEGNRFVELREKPSRGAKPADLQPE